MNLIGLVFTLMVSASLLILPRHMAAIPLLIGAAYMTRGQVLEVGSAHFPVMRILVMVGILRVMLKGERIKEGINRVDLFLILWAFWLIGSSAFHTSDAWMFRIGMVLTELGSYFLFRIFIQDTEEVEYIFKVLCLLLIPVAIIMLLEKLTVRNYFDVLGGVDDKPAFRNGHIRAQGPFNHPILAGTVGAGCLPMALYFWRSHRKLALMGLFGAGGMVFSATSSGPIMMVFFSLFGLMLWKVRKYLSAIRWIVLFAVIVLDRLMKDPVYYLMARIDISGGSTGWHRAELIRSSIKHLNEWWLIGTDYTRHWMATGIPANQIHTDITNHLLTMGVMGGLPLMILMIMALIAAFGTVGRTLRENEGASMEHGFLIWTLGAILFGHVINFFSIVLYDQSVVFFYLILASIGAVQVAKQFAVVEAKQSIGRFTQSRYVTIRGEYSKKMDLAAKIPLHLEYRPASKYLTNELLAKVSESIDQQLVRSPLSLDGAVPAKFRVKYRM